MCETIRRADLHVAMQEPGYIAIKCKCETWDQFPLFEGKVDLVFLLEWAEDHRKRCSASASA